jgi:hypothetical protein
MAAGFSGGVNQRLNHWGFAALSGSHCLALFSRFIPTGVGNRFCPQLIPDYLRFLCALRCALLCEPLFCELSSLIRHKSETLSSFAASALLTSCKFAVGCKSVLFPDGIFANLAAIMPRWDSVKCLRLRFMP